MRRERRRSKIVINITSMIDIIFLLLLFFLVTSTFSSLPGLDIDLPSAASAQASQNSNLVLTVSAGGAFFLNRQPVLRGDLPGLLAAKAKGEQGPTLILKADQDIPYGLAVEIMDISRRAGLKKIIALTNPGVPKASE